MFDAREKQENGRDWITLAVADTGIGMTAEQMGKLFQEFSQASSTTASKYGNGPRSRHQPAVLSDDGRRHYGDERAGPWVNLHRPAAENCGSPQRHGIETLFAAVQEFGIGSAPRRRELSVEEESTRRVVD